jgi:short-subunit dehydrogenase
MYMASVLLLGAGSDIAQATARKFAEDGYDIYLAGRNMEQLAELGTDLQIRYRIHAAVFPFDATQYTLHADFYRQLPQTPDITICVFGYLGSQEKALNSWQEAAHIAQTNYLGAMSILNIVAEDYIARKRGTIIGISSVAGERGRQSNYIYGSAKAGFTAYLSGLRNRLYQHGIHVITVLPGFVYTRMTSELPLPPLLTARPAQVAAAIKKAVDKKRNIVYVKWMWRWIMLSIKLIPEGMFKKMQL